MAVTNTPDKSEMKACPSIDVRASILTTIKANREAGESQEVLVRDLTTLFHKLFALSRPPADQVPDMVEAANAVGSALDDWIRIVAVRNELNPDLRHYVWKRSPTYEEVQEAMRANNELAKAIAALQASGEE